MKEEPSAATGSHHLSAIEQVIAGNADAADETAAVIATLTAVRTLPHVDAVAYHETDRATGKARLKCAQELPADTRARLGTLHTALPPFHHVLVQGQPVFIEDIRDMGTHGATFAPYVALAMVPVNAIGDVIGSLSVLARRPRDWDADDQLTLPAAGRELGAAIGRLRSQKALNDRRLPLQDLFDALHEMLLVTTADGRILWANDALKRRLGLNGGDWGQRTFLDLHPPGRRIEAAAALARVLEQAGATTSVPLLGKGDELVDVETSVRWGLWDGRRVLFMVSRERPAGRVAERPSTSRSAIAALDAVTAVAGLHDPATAVHSRRVAEIAVRIAERLELSADRRKAIGLAAGLHDVGKVAIPLDVLSRPGRLSPAERSLVRSHPLAGSQIVGEAESPWPLAEMILQHHERLDGSGYPRGLRGSDICTEARILAVADVFEAMSAPRPYRSAHGIDRALRELRAGSGRRYDPDVVDACEQVAESGSG